MLRAILNKSWRQHPTKQQLYDHLPSITKTIQVKRTSHAGHCRRSGDELISDILLWTPSHGRAKAGRPARTYTQQRCTNTGLKTYREQWMIERGCERGSGRSVLAARHDDDDDDDDIGIIQCLMFIPQHCFHQRLHQMMTLGSGLVSRLKHHFH